MSNQVLEKKVRDLSREMTLLRSAVLSVVGSSDPEGKYRPEFVRSVLKAQLFEEGEVFDGAQNFLSKIRRKA